MPPESKTTLADADYLSSPEFETELIHDDGLAARRHLEAGRPIYYGDEAHPGGLVKQYPDGRRQLVTVGPDRRITVVRDL